MLTHIKIQYFNSPSLSITLAILLSTAYYLSPQVNKNTTNIYNKESYSGQTLHVTAFRIRIGIS